MYQFKQLFIMTFLEGLNISPNCSLILNTNNLSYFIRQIPNPATAGSARINAQERQEEKTSEKSEEKERDRGKMGENSYFIPGN